MADTRMTKSKHWRNELRWKVYMPAQAWWRRLLRLDRPAQKVVIGFHFRNAQWHAVECEVVAPKGTDEVEVVWAFLDGSEMQFDPQTPFVYHIKAPKEGK